MLLKVMYSTYKCYYMFTMIYGEILKTGEKWLSMLSFFDGLFNADSKLPKFINIYGYPRDLSFRKIRF